MASDPLSTSAKKNVEAIAQVEQELHRRRSRVKKIGDWIARFFASLWFIAAHAVFFTVWIVLNVRVLPGVQPFDPYPFPFLGFIVGIEFIFLTTFVLMNQNLHSKRQEQWDHLTLQVCLLAEQEVTKNMQMLHLICQHMGLEKPSTDEESKDLAQTTPVTALVEEIEKSREVGEALVEEVGKVREAGQELIERWGRRGRSGSNWWARCRRRGRPGPTSSGNWIRFGKRSSTTSRPG